MRFSSLKSMWLLVFLVTAICTTPVYATESDQGISQATKEGIGCIAVSAVAMTAALWAGPSEVIMIAAGGLLVPSGVTPLLASLTGTLIAASCSVGSAATPATLWLAEQVGIIQGQKVISDTHPVPTNIPQTSVQTGGMYTANIKVNNVGATASLSGSSLVRP